MPHSHSSIKEKISNRCLSIYSQGYLSLCVAPTPLPPLCDSLILSSLFNISTFNFLLYALLAVSSLCQYCIELVFVALYLRTLQ